jgi:hypothetical protein
VVPVRIAVVAVFLLLSAARCFALDNIEAEMKTRGYLNGNAIMAFMGGDESGKLYATQFISGVLEGMSAIKGGEVIREIYPDTRREQVIAAVIDYYMKNPSKRYRPVVDVVLSGCR